MLDDGNELFFFGMSDCRMSIYDKTLNEESVVSKL